MVYMTMPDGICMICMIYYMSPAFDLYYTDLSQHTIMTDTASR